MFVFSGTYARWQFLLKTAFFTTQSKVSHYSVSTVFRKLYLCCKAGYSIKHFSRTVSISRLILYIRFSCVNVFIKDCKYHSGDQVKKTEMGRTCGTYGGEERCIQGFSGET
jgi:hypothetical protein